MYTNSNSKHQYSMGNTTLSQTTAERDLGVNIDDSLKFHKHTSTVVSKANQIMAVIWKSFEHLDRTTVPLLYKMLIRPHLEYGNATWGPHLNASHVRPFPSPPIMSAPRQLRLSSPPLGSCLCSSGDRGPWYLALTSWAGRVDSRRKSTAPIVGRYLSRNL